MMKLTMILLGLLLFSGCSDRSNSGKHDNGSYATKACLKELSHGEDLSGPPIDKIVVYKKKRRMYTYSKGKRINVFPISLGKNCDKGDKVQAGDHRTPEGYYEIVRKKCDSRLYKSLMISYPNAADKARAAKRGVNPGGYITIHGQPKWNADGRGDDFTLSRDWTDGCMALPNKAMDKLWYAVAHGVKIVINA